MAFLILAILLEIAGTTAMKLSDGFIKIVPSVLMALFYIGSLGFMTMSLKQMNVSIAYAIWSGIGTAGITLIGLYFFNESINFSKILGLGMIIGGVILLNLSGELH